MGVEHDLLAQLTEAGPTHLSHQPQRLRHHVRSIRLTPVGVRSEERRVGLHQDEVGIGSFKTLTELMGVLEGHTP